MCHGTTPQTKKGLLPTVTPPHKTEPYHIVPRGLHAEKILTEKGAQGVGQRGQGGRRTLLHLVRRGGDASVHRTSAHGREEGRGGGAHRRAGSPACSGCGAVWSPARSTRVMPTGHCDDMSQPLVSFQIVQRAQHSFARNLFSVGVVIFLWNSFGICFPGRFVPATAAGCCLQSRTLQLPALWGGAAG